MAHIDSRPTAAWSPWLAGAGIGVVAWMVFGTLSTPLGITRAIEDLSARFTQFFAPGIESTAHFTRRNIFPDWEWFFLIGIPIGALISSYYFRDRNPGSVPDLWRRNIGGGRALRFTAAFFGALVMVFGARLAGGCTTGHGMSGLMQLASASVPFVIIGSIAAMLTARLMYGREA
jgi:uncharacterized membrane protein YedE/YeeE